MAKKRGRPRKHRDNAAKQQAYYRRKQNEERITLIEYLFRTYKRLVSREEISQWTLRKLRYRWEHDRPRQLRWHWKQAAQEAIEAARARNIVTSHIEPNTPSSASIRAGNESCKA